MSDPKKYNGKKWDLANNSANLQNINQLKVKKVKVTINNKTTIKKIVEDYGENHPKEALLILGHGNEGWKLRNPIEVNDSEEEKELKNKDLIPDLIKVPEGSIVVIKSHPGDVRLTVDVVKDYIEVLKKENEDTILDPVGHIDNLTKLIGSVSIFREGDMCPNIVHNYCASWNEDHPEIPQVDMRQSGIVSIPLKDSVSNEEINADFYHTTKEVFDKYDIINNNFKDKITNRKDTERILKQFKYMDNTFPGKIPGTYTIDIIKREVNKWKDKNTIIEVFNKKMDALVLQNSQIFERKPNTIIYALNCRFINDHKRFVPESVRLGVDSEEKLKGIINYKVGLSEQTRDEYNSTTPLYRKVPPNSKQEKSHIQKYINAMGKAEKGYEEIRNPKHMGEFKVVKRSNFISPVINPHLPHNMHNNSINIARTRKRVTNMANEIKQEISESALQRKLGAVAISKKNRNANKINSIMTNYKYNFEENLSNPYSGKNRLNVINKIYPGIKEKIFNKIINNIEYIPNNDRYKQLQYMKTRYTKRNNNISREIKKISNSLINKPSNSIYNKMKHKNILKGILQKNNTRKNNIIKRLSELDNLILDEIINSDIPIDGSDMIKDYTILYNLEDKTNPKIKEKLDNLLSSIYDDYKDFILRDPSTKSIIDNLKLDATIHSQLIEYLQKREAEEFSSTTI